MNNSFDFFEIEMIHRIAVVTINREAKSNAFNEGCWEELGEVFDELDNREDVRVVLLCAKGKNFSAGMDLSTLMAIPSRWENGDEAVKRKSIQAFIRKIQDCISSIENCSKPVIASVQGACIGGALSIVTACDFCFASEDAYFSIKEAQLGIVPDIGVLQRMPNFVPSGKLAELSYTARNFDANEAMEIALVNQVFPNREECFAHSKSIAERIEANSPLVIQGIKKMLLYKRDHSVEESLDYVSLWNASYLLSNDLVEAMTAYMEKRKAQF